MAIHIKIRKFKEQNSLYYYLVEHDSIGKAFCVSIDQKAKKIYFYAMDDLNNPLEIVDLNDLTREILVPGMSNMIIFNILIKLFRAMENNDFPETLDYCA